MSEWSVFSRPIGEQLARIARAEGSAQALGPDLGVVLPPGVRLARTVGSLANGDYGPVTLVGSGDLIEEVYNPGPALSEDARVRILWTAGTEIFDKKAKAEEEAEEDEESEEPAGDSDEEEKQNEGQWEIIPTSDDQATVTVLGLPKSACQCGRSVRGRPVTDCAECSCMNTVRRTGLPRMTSLDGDAWPEVQTIAEIDYQGNCVHKSKKIPGIACQVEGEEGTSIVRDEYQFITDYANGFAEFKCITEFPQCPVVYIRWEFCPSCAKECTSVWIFRRITYENVLFLDGDCEICVTPLKDRTPTEIPCSKCPPEVKFVLPGEVQLRIFDHPVPSTKMCGVEIDPENPEGPGIPGHTISASYTQCHFNGKHLLKRPTNKEGLWIAADYGIEAGWKQTIELDILDFLESDVGDLVMCKVVWSKQFIRYVCNHEPPCPAEGFIPNSILHQQWTWLQLEDGDKWRIRAYLRAGESSSELCGFFRTSYYQSAKAYTCEELRQLQNFDPDEEDAPEVELLFVEGFDSIGEIEPLPSLWFSFQIPAEDSAPSSGETGKSCGPPDEQPCTRPCKVVVALTDVGAGLFKYFRRVPSKGCGTAFCHCQGMELSYCGGFVTQLGGIGHADDFAVGTEFKVPCVLGVAGSEAIEVAIDADDMCECPDLPARRLCLGGEDYFNGAIVWCGNTYNITVSLNVESGMWQLSGLGTGGESPTLSGTYYVGTAGPCTSVYVDVTVPA
jgi:hypothetical protein